MRARVWMSVVCACAAACLFPSLSDLVGDAGDATTDGVAPDGGSPGNYHAFGDASNWSAYDLKAIGGQGHFRMCAFAPPYMFFLPSDYTTAARYDTSKDFTDNAAWSLHDFGATSYGSGVFDGKYVYFLASTHAPALRYDPTQPFDQASAWTSIMLVDAGMPAVGFSGAAFDGKRVLSFGGGTIADASVAYNATYDTAGAFDDVGSWRVQSLGAFDDAGSILGSTFDGRYVYGASSFVTARYDTQGAVDDPAAYALYPLASYSSQYIGVRGQTFDGRYIYFPPRPYNQLVRYDTQKSFTSSTAWDAFDTRTAVDGGVSGYTAVFDGRYVYMPNGDFNGVVTRYDTTNAFDARSAYEAFDAATVAASGIGVNAAGFDGRYVYFPSSTSSFVVRFDARDPPLMPNAYKGSFH